MTERRTHDQELGCLGGTQEHGSYATCRLSTEVGFGIQQEGQPLRFCATGSCSKEGYWKCKGSKCQKIGPELGRALSSDSHGRNRSLLFGRFGRETLAQIMKCPQFEEILSVKFEEILLVKFEEILPMNVKRCIKL